MMLGDNSQYKFDLYFNWYNIVHEYGHCLLDFNNNRTVGLAQEMLVNKFAVSYWKSRLFDDKLAELRTMLETTLKAFPCPIPEGETFIGWYEKIWGTEQLMNVTVYGYFQFKSVLIALDEATDLAKWFTDEGITDFSLPESKKSERPEYTVEAASAQKILTDLMEYLKAAGVNYPEVCIELVDDPSQHFCRPVTS